MKAVAMITPDPKYFANLDGEKPLERRDRGGGRGRLLENAVGKSDEAGAMGDDREGGTKSAADPNDEDGSDAKAGVGSSTTA